MWKLKLDENGNVVVQDGKPVYIKEIEGGEAEEMVFDAPDALSKIAALNNEAKEHRLAKEEALEKLKAFKSITDPAKALEALKTIQNLEDEELVKAEKVEELKKQLGEIYETEKTQLVTEHEKIVGERDTTIADQENTIRHLSLTSEFAKSPWFNGEKPKTILPPDMGADFFGKYFKVEGSGRDVKIVGYLNGAKILSKDPQKLGEPAGFETAIPAIVEAYPDKNRILRSTPGGPGAHGNDNIGEGSIITLSKAEAKDPGTYKAARDRAEKTGASLNIV